MDKIFKAFDSKNYELAISLIDKQLLAAKAENQKFQLNCTKAYAHVHLGQYGYARQLIDVSKYAQIVTVSEIDQRVLPQLNFLYAINFDQSLQYCNFDTQKYEPIEKLLNKAKTQSKNVNVVTREKLSIDMSLNFIKLCKRQNAQAEQLIDDFNTFICLIEKQDKQSEELKNINSNSMIGDRLHRDHGLQILNNIFMFVSMIISNKSVDQELYLAFLKRWLENEFVGMNLSKMNSRLHMLLTNFIEDPQNHNKQILQSLLLNYKTTQQVEYVDPIIDFSVGYESLISEQLVSDNFWSVFILKSRLVTELQNSDVESLLLKASTVEQFQAIYNLVLKSKITIIPSEHVFTLLFQVQQLDKMKLLLSQIDDTTKIENLLMISSVLTMYAEINSDLSGLKDNIPQILILINKLQENYQHNVYNLQTAIQTLFPDVSTYNLSLNFLAQTQTAHNLYYTSAPHIFPRIFSQKQQPNLKLSEIAFNCTQLINHTDEKAILHFPQIIAGMVLYKSESSYEMANNAFDALLNAANPYTAARILESKNNIVLSYSRLFSDAISTIYNVIFANKTQLSKLNMLFEGVTGLEAGSGPAAGAVIFSQNNELVSGSSLYFQTDKFFTESVQIPNFPGQKPKQPIKTLQKFDLCKFTSEFGISMKKLFVPQFSQPESTRFGLLSVFLAAVVRTAFSEINVKSEQNVTFLKELLEVEIDFVGPVLKYFVKKILLQGVCQAEVVVEEVEIVLQESCFDFFVAGPIVEFLAKIAEIKKVDIGEVRGQIKECYKVE